MITETPAARRTRRPPASAPAAAERLARGASIAALAVLLATSGSADNWPHWRGPDRNGFSAATDLPTRWSREENVRWKRPMPDTSGSTPIVWGDRIFLSVARNQDLLLWALAADDGRLLWERLLDTGNESKRKGNLSSPSPITDGRAVWVMTGTGILTAFDFEGRELWQRDLQQEFGPFGILHGYSSSPLLVDESLYVQVLHGFFTDDPSYVLAIDSRTGRSRWRVERPTDAPKEAPDAYTTPALLEVDRRRAIVISGADYVTGHDPGTGREMWRVAGLNPTRNPMQRIVASPVVLGDIILVPSRVRPLLALSAAGGADRTPRRVWSTERGPDVPTPAVDHRHLYLLTDNGVLWCLEVRTGAIVWGPERIRSATYSASPLVADGKLYATSEQGLTTVLAAGREFRVLAENAVDEYTLSSLAVADGRLYLRTAENLYCIGGRR